MIRLATIFYACMLAMAVVLSWFAGAPSDWIVLATSAPLDAPTWFPIPPKTWATGFRLLVDTGVGFLVGLGIVLVTQGIYPKLKWGQKLTQDFAHVFQKLSWGQAFYLALLSGVAEEALFRVALQPLVTRWTTPILGVFFVGLIFGLVHSGPKKHYLIWTLFAILFGWLAGGLYAWRGGLWLPAVIHITVNTFNLKWIADKAGTLYAHSMIRTVEVGEELHRV
ncbi:MAG: CPBP family intramembrane metalloprotease [Deltaproteobacteria bacterium]|nr:MAG: CPBP family intramembrane metalloprotease [Deltaproteobacteria bacterium]